MRNVDFAVGQTIPDYWLDSLQEFVSTLAANFQIDQPSATSVRVKAGAGNDQVALGMQGKWRYIAADVTAAHPGGAAATYDVYATASANDFTGTPPNVDLTNYAFALAIVAHLATPATALYRKVAELTWDGTAITQVSQLVGSVASSSFSGDVTARAGAAAQARAGAVGPAAEAGLLLGLAGDTNLYRSAANTVKTDDALEVVGIPSGQGIRVTGTPNPVLRSNANAGQSVLFNDLAAGAANPAFRLKGDGRLEWGAGGAPATDTSLYRQAANTLKTDGPLHAAGDVSIFNGVADANAQIKFVRDAAGTPRIDFGAGGASAADVNLYRSAADTLKTDDTVRVAGSILLDGVTSAFIARNAAGSATKLIAFGVGNADTQDRFAVLAGGQLEWGPGGATLRDTALWRSAAGILKTDASFQPGGVQAAGGVYANLGLATQVRMGSYGPLSVAGITFGDLNDVNLYRLAADVLATDDQFRLLGADRAILNLGLTSAGTVAYGQRFAADANYRLWIAGDGKHWWGDGTATQDVNLYRSAADVLRTDDSLSVGNNLLLTGVGSKIDGRTQGTAATKMLGFNVAATDTEDRFTILASGRLDWGPGGATAVDTNLYRAAANLLRTDDSFAVGATAEPGVYATGASLSAGGSHLAVTALSTTSAFYSAVNADTQARFVVRADGVLSWGPGNAALDANLYRASAGVLRMDGSGSGAFLDLSNATAQIRFGVAQDVNLYRSAANQLKTDDAFVAGAGAAGGIAFLAAMPDATGATLRTVVAAEAQPRFQVNFDGRLFWGAGGAAALDATLYRSSADVLKTDDFLEVYGLKVMSENLVVGSGVVGQFNGANVIALQNAGVVPTLNPASGGVLYAQSGALKWRDSSGIVTGIAPATPMVATTVAALNALFAGSVPPNGAHGAIAVSASTIIPLVYSSALGKWASPERGVLHAYGTTGVGVVEVTRAGGGIAHAEPWTAGLRPQLRLSGTIGRNLSTAGSHRARAYVAFGNSLAAMGGWTLYIDQGVSGNAQYGVDSGWVAATAAAAYDLMTFYVAEREDDSTGGQGGNIMVTLHHRWVSA